jgi:hypothetical protein
MIYFQKKKLTNFRKKLKNILRINRFDVGSVAITMNVYAHIMKNSIKRMIYLTLLRMKKKLFKYYIILMEILHRGY